MQQRRIAVMFCVTWLCGAWSSGAADADRRSMIVYEGADAAAHRAALIHAIELLPHRPLRVAIVDASDAKPEMQRVLRQLDAFIVEGSHVVYVVKQSALLHRAMAGSSLHRHALAAVLLARDGSCGWSRRTPGASEGAGAVDDLRARPTRGRGRGPAIPDGARSAPG